jgi:hypothetical protein
MGKGQLAPYQCEGGPKTPFFAYAIKLLIFKAEDGVNLSEDGLAKVLWH